MIKLSEIMNEMGHGDVNLKLLMHAWEFPEEYFDGDFEKHKQYISTLVTGKPNSTKYEIYKNARDLSMYQVKKTITDLDLYMKDIDYETIQIPKEFQDMYYQINEEKIKTEGFQEFSNKRQAGAEKISKNAKEKGGVSLLTYEHFVVKLPYYEKAKQGKFDPEQGKREYKRLIDRLVKASEDVNISQTAFQRLVGKIEVVGELIIKSREK